VKKKVLFSASFFGAVRRTDQTFLCLMWCIHKLKWMQLWNLSFRTRVTRFGVFFAHWAIVYFGEFLNCRSSTNYWATFFYVECYVLILTKKMGWAIFWAIFSQTLRVTLFRTTSSTTGSKNFQFRSIWKWSASSVTRLCEVSPFLINLNPNLSKAWTWYPYCLFFIILK
jgi:hypothetical protein